MTRNYAYSAHNTNTTSNRSIVSSSRLEAWGLATTIRCTCKVVKWWSGAVQCSAAVQCSSIQYSSVQCESHCTLLCTALHTTQHAVHSAQHTRALHTAHCTVLRPALHTTLHTVRSTLCTALEHCTLHCTRGTALYCTHEISPQIGFVRITCSNSSGESSW